MADGWKGPARASAVLALATATAGIGLGSASRLTYHEAFVAQAGREMLASGDPVVPTIAGRPWLEKPPLPYWLAAASGRMAGRLDEAEARLPSAIASALVALGVASLAARRFGPGVGLLAGAVQATTAWTVMRGRLAEADILLAALLTWCLVAFDALRGGGQARRRWRWAFFLLLGATSLAKGIGFGAALAAATIAPVLLWDRDLPAARRLLSARKGWAVATALALAWPAAALLRHPEAFGLWTLHVADRLADRPEHFAGDPWWSYAPALLGQALPWTPLALLGAWASLGRARRDRGGPDRLLWAWAVGPVALLSLATVKNGHYAIHALPPWSIWAALSLARLGARVQLRRGWTDRGLRLRAVAGFAMLALAIGLGCRLLGPPTDRRGREWAFYESAGARLEPGEPLALLYDDWDRDPYPTPFGPVPHDLAVRLFYLERSADAPWRRGAGALADAPPGPPGSPFAVIARPRALPDLERLGRVDALATSPPVRRGWGVREDRTYALYRVTPGPSVAAGVDPEGQARR